MPLPVINWKFVGTAQVPAANYAGTLANTLSTVGQLGLSATYADGSPRVPGSGSAWTWVRDNTGVAGATVAAYGTPPVNALNMKYIVAGDSTTTTYAKLTPDTSGTFTNNLLVGMNRNSGLYAGWALAAPFTTASSFSGYYRVISAFTGIFSVSMWESQEACVLQFNLSNGYTWSCQMGALFDPLTYSTGVTAESDGRLYFLSSSGGANTTAGATGAAFLSSVTATDNILAPTPTTVSPRCGYFSPGTATVVNAWRGGSYTPGASFQSAGGKIALVPPWITDTNGGFVGAARNFFISRDFAGQSQWMSGASLTGYTISAYWLGSTSDTIVLGV